MARRKRASLKVAASTTKGHKIVSQLKREDDLPSYSKFVDIKSIEGKSIRVFFEKALLSEICVKNPATFLSIQSGIGSGAQRNKYPPLVDFGAPIIGEALAQDFACLVIKYTNKYVRSKSSVNFLITAIKQFFDFLDILPKSERPRLLSDLELDLFSRFLTHLAKQVPTRQRKYFTALKSCLKLSKHYQSYGIDSLRITGYAEKTKRVVDANEIDRLIGGVDFSDSEMTQFMACCFYIIQTSMDRWVEIQSVSVDSLGDKYIPLDNMTLKNEFFISCIQGEEGGHQALLDNLFLHYKRHRAGEPSFYPNMTDFANYLKNLIRVSKLKRVVIKCPEAPDVFKTIFNHLKEDYFGTQVYERTTENWSAWDHQFINLTSSHHEFAIMMYAAMITGLNIEVIKSWRWSYDGKPWYENYDIELGLQKSTDKKMAQVVVIGKKARGGLYNRKIACPIKVNSPLFRYLKFLDQTRVDGREFIFANVWESGVKDGFLNKYPIYHDDGSRVTILDSRKFRKVYAGHKLMELLDDVRSPEELTAKLKTALNHQKFDTTFFSYLLKSGSANLVLNSAIVALTTDMLEKASSFKGKIKIDNSERQLSNERYLCDCTDPENPTHDIPIASRCTKYDMCLGCERSEVYAVHTPKIIYRIIQLERVMSNNQVLTGHVLLDRLEIARKTIEKFRTVHPQGESIIAGAYEVVNKALRNNEVLLPPILQI